MAAIVIVILTFLSVRGIQQIGTIIVIAFLAVFIAFIVGGFLHGLEPKTLYPSTLEGASNVFAAVAYTFIMFLGMRSIAAGGPKIKNPGKNIPRAVIISAITLVALYGGIAYVTISVVPLEDIAVSSIPLTLAAEKILGRTGATILTVAGIIAALSSLSTAIMVQSSITRGLSRDGYFPKFLLSTHKRFKTPHVSIIFGSIFYILFAATGVIEFVGYVAGFASILGFALINLALIKLRSKKPRMKRPFKVPLYPYAPFAGILVSLLLLIFIEQSALLLGFGFIVLGLVAYHLKMVGYGRIRIAFGGMSLGIGSFTALLAYAIKAEFTIPIKVPPQLTTTLFYGLICVSAVFIIAGVLNISSKT